MIDPEKKLDNFSAGFSHKFNSGKSTYFKVISPAFLGDAKSWSDTLKNMLNLSQMNLQISQGKYTLFCAIIYFGLPAPTVSKDSQFIADHINQFSIFALYKNEH